MSIGISNVPPWKKALLDKKRNNEEAERGCPTKEEGSAMSSFPTWKRDIISKKQLTKNSIIFPGENKTESPELNTTSSTTKSVVYSNENVVTTQQSSETEQSKEMLTSGGEENGENLPVLKQNPWLRADSSHTKKSKLAHRLSDSVIDRRSNHCSNHSCSETDGSHVTQNSHAVINNEEEVAYGKGFVHKLLKKFSLMSYKDEEDRIQLQSSSKRVSRSTENLLDSKIDYSTRSFSPQDRNNESLSPRSYSCSQSSDSLPSPRVSLDESGSSTVDNHKMGFEDKAGSISSDVFTSDHESTLQGNVSPTVVAVYNDITDNGELPRRNTVASARSVFENYALSDTKGQNVSPRSPRSPRTISVHSLIAVDRLSSSNDNETLVETTKDESSQKKGDIYPSQLSAKPVVLSPKPTSDSSQQSRSKYFPGKPQGSTNKGFSNKASSDRVVEITSYNGMDTHGYSKSDLAKPHCEVANKGNIFVKNGDVSKSNDIVNGHVNGENTRMNGENTVTLVQKVEGSFKKRKAPVPVKVLPEIQSDSKKHVTSVVVNNSSTTIKNVPVKPGNVSTVIVASSQQTDTKGNHGSKILDVKHQSEITKKNDAKRPNLSLKLEKAGPNTKTAGSVKNNVKVEEPRIPINENANRKAKFKVPKSTEPGSLLIRPASNMVQGKGARFVSLEFKYHDIKTGDFAPAKKKPAHYDEYSDDSDEDILVTNIDDVIEGDGQTSTLEKDANANVPKQNKRKKHDFIGQGVLLSKSSFKTRNTELTLRFNDHAGSIYEYPSQRFLLKTMSPEVGDFDHPDTVYNEMTTPSDEDIPDMEEPSTTLKATPALSSTSGSMSDYQSKMQVDFHFGMDPIQQTRSSQPTAASAKIKNKSNVVRPADEDDTVHWSESKTSDLLF